MNNNFESYKMSINLNSFVITNSVYNLNNTSKSCFVNNYKHKSTAIPAKHVSFGLRATYKSKETCVSMFVKAAKRMRWSLFPPGQKINSKILRRLMKKLGKNSAIVANCAEDYSRTIFKRGRPKELKNKYFELIHERRTPNGYFCDNPNNPIEEIYRETIIILNKRAQSVGKTKYNQAVIHLIDENNNLVQEKMVFPDPLYKYIGASKAAKLFEKRIDRFLTPEKYGCRIELLNYRTEKRPPLFQLDKIKNKLINFRKFFATALHLSPYRDSHK